MVQTLRQSGGRRIRRVLVQAIHADLTAMVFEFAAEHVDIAGPAVKGVAGGVNADEAVAGFDPIEETLLIRNRADRRWC